jgi:hypothetical protein
VYDKNSVLYKQVGTLSGKRRTTNAIVLQGGTVVIHGTAN